VSEDILIRLQRQMHEAALREERRGPVSRRAMRVRRRVPGPAPVIGAVAVALLALAVAFGSATLRGERETAAPKVVGTYSVASSLVGLTSGFGAAWTVDPDRREILRIDPGTRRVVARIPVPAETRVAAGAGAVWALSGDLFGGEGGATRLLRIDPASNTVVARIPVPTSGGGFGPADVQIDGDAVWVVGVHGALRIDARRNAAERFVSLTRETGGGSRGTVAVGGSVWAMTENGRLLRFDGRSGRAAGVARASAPSDSYPYLGHPGMLMLVGTKQLVRLDPATGRTLWQTALEGVSWSLTGDGGTLWAHAARQPNAPDRLVRLDARTGRRLGYVDLPTTADVAGIATVGAEVWVAAPAGKIVVVR
jgi:PQQ-like domain